MRRQQAHCTAARASDATGSAAPRCTHRARELLLGHEPVDVVVERDDDATCRKHARDEAVRHEGGRAGGRRLIRRDERQRRRQQRLLVREQTPLLTRMYRQHADLQSVPHLGLQLRSNDDSDDSSDGR
jgi:hypothetical protein